MFHFIFTYFTFIIIVIKYFSAWTDPDNGTNETSKNVDEEPEIDSGRSQNTVPIASTQVAIKGIVQYSTKSVSWAQFLVEQWVTRHSREHTLSVVGPDTHIE